MSAVAYVNLYTTGMNERTVEVVCLISEATKQITWKCGIVDVHKVLGWISLDYIVPVWILLVMAIESSRSYKVFSRDKCDYRRGLDW
jgi:hypothetical protein